MENITNIDSSVYLTGNAQITYGKKVYRRHTDCFQKKYHIIWKIIEL